MARVGGGRGGGDARLYCRAVTRYARLGSVRQTGPSFVSDVSQKRRDVERGRTSSLLAAVPVSGNEPCESGIPDNRSRKSPTVREAPHPPSPAPRETLSVLFLRHPRPTGRPLSLSLSLKRGWEGDEPEGSRRRANYQSRVIVRNLATPDKEDGHP